MRSSLSLVSLLCTLALACGGGGGGGGRNDCADLAKKVNDCMVQGGGEADPDMQASCEEITCTGSKQAVIDCVVALECNAQMEASAMACLAAQSCTEPTSCETIAPNVAACTGETIDDTIDGCESTVCTGSKLKALQCMAGITTCDVAAYNACLTPNGCPAITLN